MRPELLVVGSFVVGVTVRLPRMPVVGESLVGDMLDIGPGGKGTNLAVAAARQGAQVHLVARVGDDAFAALAYDLYAAEGIDARHVHRTIGERTAMGLVYLQPSGEHTIGVYPGANLALGPTDIAAAVAERGAAQLLATQLEIGDEAVGAAVSQAHRHGLRVLLNPAPARDLAGELLAAVDVLTPNVGEARALVGLAPDDETVGMGEVGRRLLERGPKTVIITLGGDGCLLLEQGCEPRAFPAYPVQTVDTVGAGDAFNGALAVALVEGRTLNAAIEVASVSAALTTTAVGVIPALPTLAELTYHLRCFTSSEELDKA